VKNGFNHYRKFTKGKKVKEEKVKGLAYWKLFRFASKYEIFMVFLGILFASIASFGLPYGMILYGEFTTILVDREIAVGTSTKTNILRIFGGGQILTNGTKEQIYQATLNDSAAFGIGCAVGSIVQLIFAALSINVLNYVAQKQITKIRKLFFKSVLRQDMTWYDLNTSENFAVRMTE
jgi:ATP-binding cassette, subfamily B (MDR/TAP), member 1